jgi:co-chaperonin GroES (HSP10)
MSNVTGKLRPIRDHVIVTEMKFDRPVSRGGIILPADDGKSSGVRPRWAQVYAVGPEQKDVEIGQWVLVSHGRWTRGVNLRASEDDLPTTVRRVDATDILAVSDQRPLDCDL